MTPRGSLKVLIVVWKAADTRALDPLARTRNGEDDGVTVRPLLARKLATEAWVDAVGAKRASNWPFVSQWWYELLFLSYRAASSAFSPAGSRGATATSICIFGSV